MLNLVARSQLSFVAYFQVIALKNTGDRMMRGLGDVDGFVVCAWALFKRVEGKRVACLRGELT
jgi:uncharacterized protein YodC (DUF2158 family)